MELDGVLPDSSESNEFDDQMEVNQELHSCDNCDMSFLNLENLQCHEIQCKNRIKRFHCNFCNRKFNRELNRDLHQNNCDRNDTERVQTLKQTEFVISSLKAFESDSSWRYFGATWRIVEHAKND